MDLRRHEARLAGRRAAARALGLGAELGISTSKRNLIASGEVLLFDGFLKVYMEGRDEEGDEEGAAGSTATEVGATVAAMAGGGFTGGARRHHPRAGALVLILRSV